MEDGADVTLPQLLRDRIEEGYNLEDLRSLCWDLELNYDELPGDRLSRKVIALLVAVYQAKAFRTFHQLLVESRENYDWPSLEDIEAYDWSKLAAEVDFPNRFKTGFNRLAITTKSFRETTIDCWGSEPFLLRGITVERFIPVTSSMINGLSTQTCKILKTCHLSLESHLIRD
jgi:hypothetical protein